MRRAGDRVRISAQLIDAENAGHLWAKRFDRDFEDIFAVQNEVTQIVTGMLGPKLQAADAARIMNENSARLGAYDLVLRALAHWHHLTRVDHEETHQLAQAAIDIDPSYARTHRAGDDPDAYLAAGLEAPTPGSFARRQ